MTDLIAEGRALLEAANTGTLEVYDANEGDGWPPRPLWSAGNEALKREDDDANPVNIIIDTGGREHADLIAWAANNLGALLDALESAQREGNEARAQLYRQGVRFGGAMRDVRRILTDFGVTNPPPRLAALLKEGADE